MCRTHFLRRGVIPSFAGSLALIGLVAAISPAGATSMILEGTANLLDHADTVVTGTVISIEPRLHPEHQFIYTYVTLEVAEVLKGSAVTGQQIVLEELGGRVDKSIHHVAGVPQFEIGERVLNFLEDRPDGLYRTYGMIQGKLRFETDTRSNREILTRPTEAAETYLAYTGDAFDLTSVRADGSFLADPLLDAIRNRVDHR